MGPVEEGQVACVALVPDNQRAVFIRGVASTGNLYEVCVAPLDASSLPLRLNPTDLFFNSAPSPDAPLRICATGRVPDSLPRAYPRPSTCCPLQAGSAPTRQSSPRERVLST